jgi:hypothetical protein
MVRRRAKRGVSNHEAAPSFETHGFAMLLRMRAEQHQAREYPREFSMAHPRKTDFPTEKI